MSAYRESEHAQLAAEPKPMRAPSKALGWWLMGYGGAGAGVFVLACVLFGWSEPGELHTPRWARIGVFVSAAIAAIGTPVAALGREPKKECRKAAGQ